VTDGRTEHALSCFVSAGASTDTSAIKEVLTSLGVRVRDLRDLPPGSEVSRAVTDVVLSADFICVVLGSEKPGFALVFEAGIAAGSRRPMVVVSIGETDPVVLELLGSPIVRYEPGKEEALAENIRSYVQFVQPLAAQLTVNWETVNTRVVSAGAASNRGHRLEQRVFAHLARLGALVYSNVEIERGVEADGLVAFPLLGDSFNPIVVEVKQRRRGDDRETEARLLKTMSAAGSKIGLLVYEHIQEGLKIRRHGQVQLLVTGVNQLEEWSAADLLRHLTEMRNELIHTN
jgi:hypothetical protein